GFFQLRVWRYSAQRRDCKSCIAKRGSRRGALAAGIACWSVTTWLHGVGSSIEKTMEIIRNETRRSLHDFEIHPLRCGSVLLISQRIGDDDLNHVFTGNQISSKENSTPANQALGIRLRLGVIRICAARENFLAIAKQARLCGQLRMICRLIEPRVVNHETVIQRHAAREAP